MSRFVHLEKFSVTFQILAFVSRVKFCGFLHVRLYVAKRQGNRPQTDYLTARLSVPFDMSLFDNISSCGSTVVRKFS